MIGLKKNLQKQSGKCKLEVLYKKVFKNFDHFINIYDSLGFFCKWFFQKIFLLF